MILLSSSFFVNFLAIDNDVVRRFDADPNLRTIDCHDGHAHVVADADGLSDSSRQ
jgi:hypothetical protein